MVSMDVAWKHKDGPHQEKEKKTETQTPAIKIK